jgi:hypothetical protein
MGDEPHYRDAGGRTGASWGYLVAWRLSQGGFCFRYGWWADVVPGDEATLWRIPAVTGRYG